MDTNSNYDPDIIHNLQKADEVNHTGEEFIRMTQSHGLDKPRENQEGGILKYIGAILTAILVIFILLSYLAYASHWFADIFTGKCSLWSLGFLCTSG